MNPNYGKAYKNRGVVYTETGESKKRSMTFSKAIFLNTDLAETYKLQRQAYIRRRGDEERARLDFERPKRSNRSGPEPELIPGAVEGNRGNSGSKLPVVSV